MKSYKYSDHSISRCMYMYPLLDINVESDYIKSSSGFSKLSVDVNNSDQERRVIIPDSDKHEADSTSLIGYFETDFSLNMSWNVLVITDSDNTPLSIIYDTYVLNTREVQNIHLKYTLNYESGSLISNLNIGREYELHMEEYIGTNMQPIPKMMSRTAEVSEVEWSDKDYNMSYSSADDTLNDNKTFSDYLLKLNINPKITYESSSKYFMTGTTQDIFIIKVANTNEAKLYPLNRQSDNIDYESEISIGTIPIPISEIAHIDLIENGYGIIVVSKSGEIFYSISSTRRGTSDYEHSYISGWGFTSWSRVKDLNDYDLLIPTFIDLCGSYIKLPKVSTKTPTAYEVKKWTGLLDEDNTYGDRIYTTSYNYPNSINPGDQELRISYWESLGIQNQNTFFMSSNPNQDSPVSMHQFDVISPIEGNSVVLDFNLKLMTSLYVDLFNNGRLTKKAIFRDCGIELINESGGNEFITYMGEHYRVPENANIMNMSYYTGSTIVSLVTGRVQDLGSNILCAKYGIVLTQNMIS